MSTLLKKQVVREVSDWCRTGTFGLGGKAKRNLVISLEPGAYISFREKGLRRQYDIDMESVFRIAVRRTLQKEDEEKKKEKKLRRLCGRTQRDVSGEKGSEA